MKSFKIVMIVFALVVLSTGLALAAVSTSTIHANSVPGDSIITNDTMFEMDATPKYPVGTKVTMTDGRSFRYAHFGADTTQGLLVAQDNSETSSLSASGAIVVVAPASAQTTTDGTISSKFVEVTMAGVTANQFAGGYLNVVQFTGYGYTYRIKSNTATGVPATGKVRIELYDKLQVALDATSFCTIIGSLYSDLEAATTTDEIVAGVAVSTMDVSEAAYGWIQTSGASVVLQDSTGGAFTLGCIITTSDGVAGACQLQDAYTEPIIGYCLDFAAGTGYAGNAYCVVNLTLE